MEDEGEALMNQIVFAVSIMVHGEPNGADTVMQNIVRNALCHLGVKDSISDAIRRVSNHVAAKGE